MNSYRFTLCTPLMLLCCLCAAQVQPEYRSIDGSGNNISNPEIGAANSPLRILTTLDFSDGISEPAGAKRANARMISNGLCANSIPQSEGVPYSDYVWVFGKFIGHDIALLPESKSEIFSIEVPPCDPVMDPNCTGGATIPAVRSVFLEGTGNSPANPRRWANTTTSWIDASVIYGNNDNTALWLRTNSNGKLKTSRGNLLPFNTIDGELESRRDNSAPYMLDNNNTSRKFVAGDIRVNENLMLTAMHTLLVREHNRLCDEIIKNDPAATDEQIYQRARKMVGALLQSITFNEWLPTIGIQIESFKGYKSDINPTISNEFASAAFRFWATLSSPDILRKDEYCQSISQGDMKMNDGIYNSLSLLYTGIEPLFKGMSIQQQQQMDCRVIDELRNVTLDPKENEWMDLAALNIFTGREHGLPDYNTIRDMIGIGRVRSFEEICTDPVEATVMKELYGTIDNVDPWIGMLAEEHLPGSLFGESITTILKSQFVALRDADRFYFENDPALTPAQKSEIRSTTLADIILRNSTIDLIQSNVFVQAELCNVLILDAGYLNMVLFPNPVREQLTIAVYAFDPGTATIRIVDNFGKVIHTEERELSAGSNTYPVELSGDFPPGIYFLQIEKDAKVNIAKFFKSK